MNTELSFEEWQTIRASLEEREDNIKLSEKYPEKSSLEKAMMVEKGEM